MFAERKEAVVISSTIDTLQLSKQPFFKVNGMEGVLLKPYNNHEGFNCFSMKCSSLKPENCSVKKLMGFFFYLPLQVSIFLS